MIDSTKEQAPPKQWKTVTLEKTMIWAKTTKNLPIMSPATASPGTEEVEGYTGLSLKQKKQQGTFETNT